MGGWQNSASVIRFKNRGVSQTKVSRPNVIGKDTLVKFYIEITTGIANIVQLTYHLCHYFIVFRILGGLIKIFLFEDDEYKPLMVAFDPSPLAIQYLNFGSFGGKDIVQFFVNCPGDKCLEHESETYVYDKFYQITDAQAEGFILKFPFYVKGSHGAHILLTTTDNTNDTENNVYEIGKSICTLRFSADLV